MGEEYYLSNISCSLTQEIVDIDQVEIEKLDIGPEKKVIKYDLYLKTSEEAKEVISIIINTPQELVSLISTPKGKITKPLLQKYLLRRWKSSFLVDCILKEISDLVKQF